MVPRANFVKNRGNWGLGSKCRREDDRDGFWYNFKCPLPKRLHPTGGVMLLCNDDNFSKTEIEAS